MHLVSPRTLLFLERDGDLLFLRGGPRKWFAARLNGLGGHVEPGEGVAAGAAREAEEETGLVAADLRLAAIVHTVEEPPVVIFVFVGTLPPGDLRPTDEGDHVWLAPSALDDPEQPFVPDVRALCPAAREAARRGVVRSFTMRPPGDPVPDDPAGSEISG